MTTRSPILFMSLCYSWMRPYVQAELRRRWIEGSRIIAVVESPAHRADFAWLPADAVTIFDIPRGVISGKLHMLYPRAVIKEAERQIKAYGIGKLVSLSIDQPLWLWLPRMQARIDTEYVIHNVSPHKRIVPGIYKRLIENALYIFPERMLIKKMRQVSVNALWQKRVVEERYPDKRVTYSPFPSTVTPEIIKGTDALPELAGLHDYILFFGRVEEYKGVDHLIEAVKASPELCSRTLVIAGPGDARCQLPPNALHINRYINDNEIARLFGGAAVVVYPYRRATQTGVLSVASYFGTPMVLSDVEYFKELVIDPVSGAITPGCRLVDASDPEALATAITETLSSPQSSRPLYDRLWTREWPIL